MLKAKELCEEINRELIKRGCEIAEKYFENFGVIYVRVINPLESKEFNDRTIRRINKNANKFLKNLKKIWEGEFPSKLRRLSTKIKRKLKFFKNKNINEEGLNLI
uniref:Uncharacterized protein n=1 Tax=Meloidogyne enterolobii TaxID=390850 RepID=A0A6V7XPL7_MELEN|nr:unnamed protein product [Meloidogyne enterolobii]